MVIFKAQDRNNTIIVIDKICMVRKYYDPSLQHVIYCSFGHDEHSLYYGGNEKGTKNDFEEISCQLCEVGA